MHVLGEDRKLASHLKLLKKMDKIQFAWQIATKMHDGQKYKGYEKDEHIEYLSHIGSVAFEIYNATANNDNINTDFAVICAILHDTLEDSPLQYAYIVEHFGIEIAEGIKALTKDDKILDKTLKMLDSLGRIKQQPKEIWMVKLADRICNLKTPPFFWNKEKIITYKAEAEIIYSELKAANKYLADRLLDKINAYNKFI